MILWFILCTSCAVQISCISDLSRKAAELMQLICMYMIHNINERYFPLTLISYKCKIHSE